MTSPLTNLQALSPHPGQSNGRQRVLVVDDEPSFCMAISDILSLAGYEVSRASSVRSALEQLHEKRPDLILTDIMMPERDGLSFLRELSRHPQWSRIPAIAVTAKAMDEDRLAALEAGADGYLSKPFSAGELKRAIRELLDA